MATRKAVDDYKPKQLPHTYRYVRSFFVQNGGGCEMLRSAVSTAVPAAVAMETDTGVVKFMLEQTKAELLRRVEQYECEYAWILKHEPEATDAQDYGPEANRQQARFALREAKTCLAQVERFLIDCDRVGTWAERNAPYLHPVECTSSEPASEEELASCAEAE